MVVNVSTISEFVCISSLDTNLEIVDIFVSLNDERSTSRDDFRLRVELELSLTVLLSEELVRSWFYILDVERHRNNLISIGLDIVSHTVGNDIRRNFVEHEQRACIATAPVNHVVAWISVHVAAFNKLDVEYARKLTRNEGELRIFLS